MAELRVRPQPIVDPRGEVRAERVSLALRPASLVGLRILLFDNGKLAPEYGAYDALFEVLAEHLREHYRAEVVRQTRDLLDIGSRAAALRVAESEILPRRPDAVVIAFCDAGVTLPSTLLAVELERQGIPTLLIGNELGSTLATTIADGFAPGLPNVRVSALRSASAGEVARAAAGILDPIKAALTAGAVSPAASAPGQPLGAHLRPVDGELRLDAERVVAAADDPAGFAADFYEALSEAQLTDGLPVIPPTRERVDAMLARTDRPPDLALLPECTPSGAAITVGKLAVSAVMAGCKPEYFPIVVAAMEAMCEPQYRLPWAVLTTHPAGNCVVVSGPLARELGIQSGYGCLGPGFRANATIGRALTLAAITICRAIPGVSDLSAMGSPAEYTYCFAENTAESPWPGRHADLYDAETTCVTVLKVEGPRNQIEHLAKSAEGILSGLATGLTGLLANNAYRPAEALVILNPEHAAIIAADGWSKPDVQQFLFERARNPRHKLAGRGIVPDWPPEFHLMDQVPIVQTPSELLVIVAGGPAPQSMVALPWGFSRAATRPVVAQNGSPIRALRSNVR